VVDGDPSRRVLISVAPPLLGDLLARELYRADLEIVVAGEHGGFRDRRTFDVVVTNGLPPERVDAVTVVQLPDRVRGDEVGSLVTAAGVERVPIPELACVVDLVRQLCPERRTDRD
jgi:hypothetical protein